MIRKQFTLYLENKPGTLASVAKLMARQQVNIEGISVSASTDVALVQITVDNGGVTSRTLTAAGVPFTVQDVALLPLDHTPGALAELSSRLAKAGVNISYIYATGCDGSGCHSYAIVGAPDLRMVEKVWAAPRRRRVKA